MAVPARVFEGRSTFIDALRGIAALSVACYHITRYGPLPKSAAEFIPGSLQVWFDHGWIGVQVFFVISGFVIAYSVRKARVTPGYLANYAFRRSIRLDPPYWTTILLVLALHAVMALHLEFESPLDVPSAMETPLSWKLLASHVFYLQNILQLENLSAGFWTLCIEVQFYLLYVVGLGIAQRLPAKNRRSPADAGTWGLLLVFAPIAVGSLFAWNYGPQGENRFDPGQDFWITHFFCMFFLGAAVWWTLDGRISQWVLWIYVALVLLRQGIDIYGSATETSRSFYWPIDLTVALVVGLAILACGRLGRLGNWLDFNWLQYLGKISYSLYLIHFPVSHVVTTFGSNVTGESTSPAIATLWLCLALAASLAAAHVMYTFVEAPSVHFASRFKKAA